MKAGEVAVKQESVVEEVQLEEYGKANKKPHKSKVYLLRIDKTTYRVNDVLITGQQLLELADKQPIEQYKIFQKLHGGKREEIKLDHVVDLRTKGIERFQTVPLGETEG